MAKKRLNNNDKMAIQGYLLKGKTAPEIAEAISADETAVAKEISKVAASLLKIQLNQESEPKQSEPKEEPAPAPKSNRISAKDLMKNTTDAQGNKGVSAMTGAASARSDDFRDSQGKKLSRKARGNIYDLKEKKIRE